MSTAKTARLELTRMPQALDPPQWRKIHKGKRYLFRGSYAEALKQWREVQATMAADELAERLKNAPVPFEAKTAGKIDTLVFAQYLSAYEPPAKPDTMKAATDEFLRGWELLAKTGARSPQRLVIMRRHLRHFREWFGPGRPVGDFQSRDLTAYHNVLLADLADGKYKPGYLQARLKTAKQFLRWAWQNDHIKELKTLSGSGLIIEVPAKEVPIYSIDEVRRLIDGASKPIMRLFILLALNCGFTSVDIGKLHPKNVDWEKGTIRHRRTKTGKWDNVPTVTYKLWPETLELLKKCRSNAPDRVLLNRRGKPIWDGKKDYIYPRFQMLAERLGMKGSFKVLRKTGTSILGAGPYAEYVRYYGAWAPQGIIERHYRNYSDEQFANALAWLRSQIFPNDQ